MGGRGKASHGLQWFFEINKQHGSLAQFSHGISDGTVKENTVIILPRKKTKTNLELYYHKQTKKYYKFKQMFSLQPYHHKNALQLYWSSLECWFKSLCWMWPQRGEVCHHGWKKLMSDSGRARCWSWWQRTGLKAAPIHTQAYQGFRQLHVHGVLQAAFMSKAQRLSFSIFAVLQ